jgi:hypothetical protein
MAKPQVPPGCNQPPSALFVSNSSLSKLPA